MKKTALLIALTALWISCARLPDMVPNTETVKESCPSCRCFYPDGTWQLTHSIEAMVPGGKNTSLVGASVISSQDRSIQCALMTVEGFVLFSGQYNGKLTIHRAVAPFDRPGFAKGLIDDLVLLFLRPEAPMIKRGVIDGMSGCRFTLPQTGTIDVIVQNAHNWMVRKYSPKHELERSVKACGRVVPEGRKEVFFAENMSLKRHGMIGYQLDLRLLEAVPLPRVGLSNKTF